MAEEKMREKIGHNCSDLDSSTRVLRHCFVLRHSGKVRSFHFVECSNVNCAIRAVGHVVINHGYCWQLL